MTRSQRILIVVGLPLLAWVMHGLLCEWAYKTTSRSMATARIVAYRHEVAITSRAVPRRVTQPSNTRRSVVPPPRGRAAFTGLFAQSGVGEGFAVTFGVVVPLALLGLNAFLLLGWRHAARLARHGCPDCGYDLRGNLDPITSRPHGRCPECGTGARN